MLTLGKEAAHARQELVDVPSGLGRYEHWLMKRLDIDFFRFYQINLVQHIDDRRPRLVAGEHLVIEGGHDRLIVLDSRVARRIDHMQD